MTSYRTRILSSRPARHEQERSPHVDPDELDLDACRALLFAVLEAAIRDYRYLEELDDGAKLSDSERRRVRAMTEDNHQAEFFATQWFEDLCYFLGLTPDAVRDIAGWEPDRALPKAS